MTSPDISSSLTAWLQGQLPNAEDVRVEGLEKIEFGYSSDMLLFTIVSTSDSGEVREDVVLRLRPPEPGLLEPYDLTRQFEMLKALEGAAVKAPRVLFLDATGDVLGRPFFVMERLPGTAYEWEVPSEIAGDPAAARRMCESLVDELAALHAVDIVANGLIGFDDAATFLDRELDRWSSEVDRVKRGPVPALERVIAELRKSKPEPTAPSTVVHGDAKPGNFAYVGAEVSAIFDWELASIGDPLADLGYLETMWTPPMTIGIPSLEGALTRDEIVARYEAASGRTARNREWYRAFGALRIAAISLLGVMLLDNGHSDDSRLSLLGLGIPILTELALNDLGVTDKIESGPVEVRPERLAELGLGQPTSPL